MEVKIETDSNDAMEIKTEPDSNDITEYHHDDRPSVGMFGLFIFLQFTTDVRNITKQTFLLRMLLLNIFTFQCTMLLCVFLFFWRF